MAQATLSCRYAAIHLVYLGIYTREEKKCLQGAVFLRNSIESVVSIECLFVPNRHNKKRLLSHDTNVSWDKSLLLLRYHPN